MSALVVIVACAALGLAARRRVVGARAVVAQAASSSTAEPDWASLLDTVAGGVRAGHSLHESFTSARHRSPPTGQAITPHTDLRRVPSLVSDDPDESVALQTLSVALSLGGSTAAVLQSGASLLRERSAVRAEAAAHAAQARLSARVLTAVPLLFAGWGAVSSPSFRAALLGAFGAVAAVVGLMLNSVGWWWMRRIVRAAAT